MQLIRVCAVLLAVACGTVIGECEFPSNHPSFAHPEQSNLPKQLLTGIVYVYTDEFGGCSGCVTEVNFCYLPSGGSSSETILTVMIRNIGDQTTTSLGITVDPGSYSSSDRTNCIDGLNDPYCCIRQTLMEPFSVGQNHDYALRAESGVNSRALRDRHMTASGHQRFANTDALIVGSVYKPFFFFTINPDDTSDNCNGGATTTSDSPTDSDTDSMPSTEGNSDAPTTTTSDSPTDSDTDSMPSTEGNTDAPTTTPSDSPTDPDTVATTSSSTNTEGSSPDTNDGESTDGEADSPLALAVGASVAGVLVVMTLSLLTLLAAVCLKKRRLMKTTPTISGTGTQDEDDVKVNPNEAYALNAISTAHNTEHTSTAALLPNASAVMTAPNEAYAIVDASTTVITAPNEAYAANTLITAPNEAYAANTLITAPNEAYAANTVITAPNEAYAANTLITAPNEAYAANTLITAPNEAYAANTLITAPNEAYAANTLITAPNEAYAANTLITAPNEAYAANTVITAPNEAYAANTLITAPNEAYAANTVITAPNEAYAANTLITAPNEAYAAVTGPSEDTGDLISSEAYSTATPSAVCPTAPNVAYGATTDQTRAGDAHQLAYEAVQPQDTLTYDYVTL